MMHSISVEKYWRAVLWWRRPSIDDPARHNRKWRRRRRQDIAIPPSHILPAGSSSSHKVPRNKDINSVIVIASNDCVAILPLISQQLAHHHLIAVLLPWESTLAMILPTMTFIISSQGHDMTRATLDLGLSAYHTNDVIKSHPVQKNQNYLYCPVQIKPIYIYIFQPQEQGVALKH